MNIQRVFTSSQDFKTLIIHQLEKEIEKIISAAYGDHRDRYLGPLYKGIRAEYYWLYNKLVPLRYLVWEQEVV